MVVYNPTTPVDLDRIRALIDKPTAVPKPTTA
jgi:hypothetical protein